MSDQPDPLADDSASRIDQRGQTVHGPQTNIAGGVSGKWPWEPNPDWFRHVRDQCALAGVAFFFKQWGGVRKSEAGRRLDGRTHDEFPSYILREGPDAATRRLLRSSVISVDG